MLQSKARSSNYKWWVFATIAIGIFLSVIEHSSVQIALPNIEDHFDANLPTVQWVIVGYALAISVLLLPMGRLGDLLGRKQVYVAGLVIFVASSALAGVAVNMPMLIASRISQGIGSAMIQGIAMAMLISAFPERDRGKVLGLNMSVVGTGAIAGPALGGLLVGALGWRSVFLVNVPIGVITILVSALVLGRSSSGEERQRGQRFRFDWLGAALSGGVLLLLLLVVGNGNRLGWTSYFVTAGAIVFVVLLVAFIWWELRTASPLLELRLFRRKLVALGVTVGWISFLGTAATRFMMPFYLQRVIGLSPGEVGLLMIPPAFCMVVFGPLSGRLSDKFGWRRFTVGGLMLSATASFILASSLTERSPVALIVGMLMLQSAGTGLFNSPNNSSIFSAVERSRYGVVSALTQLIRNSANVVSVALATTVVVTVMSLRGVAPSLDAVSPQIAGAFVAGLRLAFLVLGSALTIGVVLTFIRGERASEAEPTANTRPRVSEASSD